MFIDCSILDSVPWYGSSIRRNMHKHNHIVQNWFLTLLMLGNTRAVRSWWVESCISEFQIIFPKGNAGNIARSKVLPATLYQWHSNFSQTCSLSDWHRQWPDDSLLSFNLRQDSSYTGITSICVQNVSPRILRVSKQSLAVQLVHALSSQMLVGNWISKLV